MSILAINTNTTGLVGNNVSPRRCTLTTTDNLVTITTAGYLNNQNISGYNLLPTDIFDVLYNFNPSTNVGTFGIFQLIFSAGTFTLKIWDNPGDVLLPVVSGDFAVFNGTTGQIKDSGFLPTNAALTRVVMQSGASVIGDIPKYNDITGTLIDSGILLSNAVLKNAVNTMASGSKIILDKGTGTESSHAVTISNQSGVITTTSLTTAQYASETITLTNTLISTSSVVIASIMGGTNTIEGVTVSATANAGTSTIVLTNTNTAALNGTVIIGFIVA